MGWLDDQNKAVFLCIRPPVSPPVCFVVFVWGWTFAGYLLLTKPKRFIHQVEQHEQLMGEFEIKYTEFKNHCFEMQHNFFRAVEEHEEGYFNSLAQLAQV